MKDFTKIILLFLNIILCTKSYAQVSEETSDLKINFNKATVRSRFSPPKGYVWNTELPDSFGEFLSNFPLFPENFPVRDFREVPIERQYNHAAILRIDVGDKDLQQCADAWIRLYSEYLWLQKKYDDIGFHFTSGQFFSWNDFKSGIRTVEINTEKVKFVKSAKPDDSYANFRKYLNTVFRYAGTISLEKEGVAITNNDNIKTGDYIIKPGNPGHSVIIAGVAKNSSGKKVYLLAESFMPAQDIHILRNPTNQKISPWYELDVNAPQTMTAKYLFKPTLIKRFYRLK